MRVLRLMDGRVSTINASNLLERFAFSSHDEFVNLMVDRVLNTKPNWTRESLEIIEAARRYREFISKAQGGDEVFFFRTPRPSSGFLLIRIIEDEPRIVTAILTEHA